MNRPPSSSRGSVLIVVMWATLGLVSIALLFGNSMMMNYRAVDNDAAGRQADQAIEGAIRYATTLLAAEQPKGVLPDITSYEAEAMPVGEAQFWILGRPDTDTTGTTRTYGLVDEASKLNLNTLSSATLQLLPGMTQQIADAIYTWRTGPSSATAKGADFESVEELALVPGMTREILYGEDSNLNGVLDANEDDGDRSPPKDNADGKLDPGIIEYLTVFTKMPAPSATLIDLGSRTAGADLSALITKTFPGKTVTLNPRPYGSATELFLISGIQSSLSDAEFDQLVPDLTWTIPGASTAGVGLINVNTASETVLAAVPGLANLAGTIVSARQSNAQPSTGLAWAARLLGPAAVAAGPYLTGVSYQVSADVAAVGRFGRGYRRSRVVFDLTGDAPAIIYRRNLAPLGWALGRDIRQQLALKKDLK